MLINFSSSQTVKIQTKVSRYSFSKCSQATVNIDLPFEKKKKERKGKNSSEPMDPSGSNPPDRDTSREKHTKKKKSKKSKLDPEVNDQKEQIQGGSAGDKKEKKKRKHKGTVDDLSEHNNSSDVEIPNADVDKENTEVAGSLADNVNDRAERKEKVKDSHQEVHIPQTEELDSSVTTDVNPKKKRKQDGQNDDKTIQNATLDSEVSPGEKKRKKDKKKEKHEKATERCSDSEMKTVFPEDTQKEKARKHKKGRMDLDATFELNNNRKHTKNDNSADNEDAVEDVSAEEKNDKKDRNKGNRRKASEEISDPVTDATPEDIPREKIRKRKKDKLDDAATLSVRQEEEEIDGAKAEKRKKKRKLDTSTNVSQNGCENSEDKNSETAELVPKSKKIKKEKHKSPEDSSLGVVDHSILQQAGTNLGLPIEESESAPSEEAPKEKRKKKKKEKTEESVEENNSSQQEGTRWTRCLDYLRLFATHRNSWRFKKASQIQLLQIMYDKSQMSDEDFALMLQYLEEIQGKAREKTREDAEKLLQDDTDTQEPEDPDKAERARQIFQLLS